MSRLNTANITAKTSFNWGLRLREREGCYENGGFCLWGNDDVPLDLGHEITSNDSTFCELIFTMLFY